MAEYNWEAKAHAALSLIEAFIPIEASMYFVTFCACSFEKHVLNTTSFTESETVEIAREMASGLTSFAVPSGSSYTSFPLLLPCPLK